MKLTSIWTCIIVLVGLIGIRIADPDIVEQLRVINFDYYQKSIVTVQNDSIVIIDIGEKSLQQFGQWPFPRTQFAQLISDLRNSNAGIIGFTTMFADSDRFGGDEVFGSWVKDNGIVLSSTTSSAGIESIAPHVGTATLGNGEATTFAYRYNSVVNNIHGKNADGVGMLSSSPEVDGSVRRIPLVISVENKLYPSFGMEVVRVMTGKKSYTMKVEETGIDNMRIPPYEPVATDHTGSIYVDWSNTFERYQYGDILPDLKGKTVIIGVTAEGISPLVTTPMGLKYSHDIQSSVIHTLTGGKQITRPQWVQLGEISLLLCMGVLLLLSVYYLPQWLSFSFFLGGSSAVVAICLNAFSYGILIDFSYFLIVFILVFSHSSFNNFYIQFKLKQQIKGQFGNYISPEYVDMIVKDPSLMKLGGERKEMSFMFADIVGFTPISESYMEKDDPEGLVELINKFLDRMTKIVLNNGGTIDKYMGDCIMAFWNAPIACENHAELAVKTAIEIELLGDELEQEMKELRLPRVKFGTGVNTGICIVGNMGSESRMDYSVVGDAVNLGARLEAQTRQEDTPIIISESTYKQCPASISCRQLGEVKVKGKEQPVKMYAPLFDNKIRKLYKD